MQSRRSQPGDGLKKPAPPAKRTRDAREAMLRVTLELLQSQAQHAYCAQETYCQESKVSNDGHSAETTSTQGSGYSSAEQKTRLLNAIQPVIEVVADSALRHGDGQSVQM
jgi:hypothetical protein